MVHYTMVRYKTVCYNIEQCYKAVHGSKLYITKWYSYKTVYVSKWCTVTKRYVTEQ
jgi:hypothetical protein